MKTSGFYFLTLFMLLGLNSLAAQNYIMSVDNLKKPDARTFEFEIFISSTGDNFVLDAYQAALNVNPDITGGGNLSFHYTAGSSELNNVPSFGTGIYNYDGVTELAFASYPAGTDLISGNKKRVGKFRLINSSDFVNGAPDFTWNFDGNVNTIVAASGFIDITDIESHKVNLNDAPVFISVLTADTISTSETLIFAYSAADANNDILSYSISSIAPAFAGELNINSANGLLTLTPTTADGGKIFSIIINITDGKEIISSPAALITVQKINHAPVFTAALQSKTIVIGDTLSFAYSAVDADEDAISYLIHSAAPAINGLVSINSSTGLFRFIPAVADTGKTFSVRIKVSDGKDTAYSEVANITVKGINTVNHAPVFSSVLSEKIITIGDTLKFTYSAVDADDDTISYSIHSAAPAVNGLVSINSSTGLFRFVPALADTGKTFSVRIKVSDGKDTAYSEAANITVKGLPKINHAPVFSSVLSEKIITIGDTLKFTYSAVDADDDAISYSIHSAAPAVNGLVSINSSTGLFRFVPALADTGKTFSVRIKVSDGKDTAYSEAANITVKGINAVNHAPVFSSVLSEKIITIGDTLSFTYSAVDADDDAISYSIHSAAPAVNGLVSINSSTGLFRFIPALADTGKTFSVRIKVSDGKDTVYSVAANISVKGLPKINHAPQFSSVLGSANIFAGDTLTYNYSAYDADGHSLIFSLNHIAPEPDGNIYVDSILGKVTFIPAANDAEKEFTLTLKVSDMQTFAISDSAIVNVIRRNNPPIIGSVIADTTIFTTDTLLFNYSSIDPDGDTLTYKLDITENSMDGVVLLNSQNGLLTVIPSENDEGKSIQFCIIISDGTDSAATNPVKINVIKNQLTGVEGNLLPENFELKQNYPNPFNPATKINFSIPAGNQEHVLLQVFDILGNHTATLVNETKNSGNYEIVFDASNFASGIYIYRFSTKNFVQTKTMNLIK